jgi:RNA polymerase sigma-70 factor (ECF subfamily)
MMRAAFKPTPAKRRLVGGSPTFHIGQVNGWPAVLAVLEDRIVGAAAFEISDGKVAAMHGFAATERLARLTEMWRQHEPDAPAIGQW